MGSVGVCGLFNLQFLCGVDYSVKRWDALSLLGAFLMAKNYYFGMLLMADLGWRGCWLADLCFIISKNIMNFLFFCIDKKVQRVIFCHLIQI